LSHLQPAGGVVNIEESHIQNHNNLAIQEENHESLLQNQNIGNDLGE